MQTIKRGVRCLAYVFFSMDLFLENPVVYVTREDVRKWKPFD